MLNRVLCVFTAFSFAAVIAVADDKSANDAKNLQGTWQAVYLEANGEKSPDDQVKELKIVFKGDQVFALKPEGEGQKCKFRLGTSKTLNTIDLTPIDRKGKTGDWNLLPEERATQGVHQPFRQRHFPTPHGIQNAGRETE